MLHAKIRTEYGDNALKMDPYFDLEIERVLPFCACYPALGKVALSSVQLRQKQFSEPSA